MIFVKLVDPNSGYDYNKRDVKNYLNENETYTLDFITMEDFSTDVYLKEVPNKFFNSVHFKFFEEDGTPINIYGDVRFNPRLTKEDERPSEFYHKDWSEII